MKSGLKGPSQNSFQSIQSFPSDPCLLSGMACSSMEGRGGGVVRVPCSACSGVTLDSVCLSLHGCREQANPVSLRSGIGLDCGSPIPNQRQCISQGPRGPGGPLHTSLSLGQD